MSPLAQGDEVVGEKKMQGLITKTVVLGGRYTMPVPISLETSHSLYSPLGWLASGKLSHT